MKFELGFLLVYEKKRTGLFEFVEFLEALTKQINLENSRNDLFIHGSMGIFRLCNCLNMPYSGRSSLQAY